MSYVNERVAYLKGLCDGMELGDTNESKLLKAIVGVLEDIADELEAIDDEFDDVAESIDMLTEAVTDCCDCDDECDCDCGCECDCDPADCAECEDDDCTFFPCPICGELIDLEELIISEKDHVTTCPVCNKEFEIDLQYEEECDDGCDCKK